MSVCMFVYASVCVCACVRCVLCVHVRADVNIERAFEVSRGLPRLIVTIVCGCAGKMRRHPKDHRPQ